MRKKEREPLDKVTLHYIRIDGVTTEITETTHHPPQLKVLHYTE